MSSWCDCPIRPAQPDLAPKSDLRAWFEASLSGYKLCEVEIDQ